MFRVVRRVTGALTRPAPKLGPGGLFNRQRTPSVSNDVRADDKAAIEAMMRLVNAERPRRESAAT